MNYMENYFNPEITCKDGGFIQCSGFSCKNSLRVCCIHDAVARSNVTKGEGNRALTVAASKGHTETVRLLIEAGANVNSEDAQGRTALQLAAFRKRLNTVKELLRAEAHVNITTKNGRNALQCVSVFKIWKLVDVMNILLFAAGETADTKFKCQIQEAIDSETQLNLKEMCRKVIRKHLLKMSPVNLFCRVPLLGLPSLLNEFLLFKVNLDDVVSIDNERDDDYDQVQELYSQYI